MIPILKHRLSDTISCFQKEIDDLVLTAKDNLENLRSNGSFELKTKIHPLTDAQKDYLIFLINKLEEIVCSDLDSLNKMKSDFDTYINATSRKKDDFKRFKNELIKLMGYETLRSDKTKALYPKFYKQLGVKACVYCNSQLTVSAEYDDKSLVARFQVDHFIDKASYPCFSISFFNLYPVCASCNNKKGNREIGFQLYSQDSIKTIQSDYKFSIDQTSVAKFRLTRNEESLEIRFDDKDHNLNKYLAVNGIFATQKDLAAEMILKAEFYNDSYKANLQKSFKNLYGQKGVANIDFNRFIIGNYTDPKDIHKRPMAKFTQDIARQLGLIP